MPIQTFEEKLRQQRTSLSTPMECEQCGSTHFYDTHAFQYSRGGYGSVEFRQLSAIPVPIKICIGCGLAVTPQASGGKAHPASTTEFQASAKAGQTWREKQKLNAAAVASKKELDELARAVDNLRASQPEQASLARTPMAEPEATLRTVLDTPDVPVQVERAAEPEEPTMGDLMKKRTGRQAKNPGKR